MFLLWRSDPGEQRGVKSHLGTALIPAGFCPLPPVALAVKPEVLSVTQGAPRPAPCPSATPAPLWPRLRSSKLIPSLASWLFLLLDRSSPDLPNISPRHQRATSVTPPWLFRHTLSLTTYRYLKPAPPHICAFPPRLVHESPVPGATPGIVQAPSDSLWSRDGPHGRLTCAAAHGPEFKGALHLNSCSVYPS